MSNKLPERFMETGDTRVSEQAFEADKINLLNRKERESEDEDGQAGEDLRHRGKRYFDQKK